MGTPQRKTSLTQIIRRPTLARSRSRSVRSARSSAVSTNENNSDTIPTFQEPHYVDVLLALEAEEAKAASEILPPDYTHDPVPYHHAYTKETFPYKHSDLILEDDANSSVKSADPQVATLGVCPDFAVFHMGGDYSPSNPPPFAPELVMSKPLPMQTYTKKSPCCCSCGLVRKDFSWSILCREDKCTETEMEDKIDVKSGFDEVEETLENVARILQIVGDNKVERNSHQAEMEAPVAAKNSREMTGVESEGSLVDKDKSYGALVKAEEEAALNEGREDVLIQEEEVIQVFKKVSESVGAAARRYSPTHLPPPQDATIRLVRENFEDAMIHGEDSEWSFFEEEPRMTQSQLMNMEQDYVGDLIKFMIPENFENEIINTAYQYGSKILNAGLHLATTLIGDESDLESRQDVVHYNGYKISCSGRCILLQAVNLNCNAHRRFPAEPTDIPEVARDEQTFRVRIQVQLVPPSTPSMGEHGYSVQMDTTVDIDEEKWTLNYFPAICENRREQEHKSCLEICCPDGISAFHLRHFHVDQTGLLVIKAP